ncbi:MAG: hypothetical protein ACRD5M_12465 [Candidatus Acidiferrales bacterium]
MRGEVASSGENEHEIRARATIEMHRRYNRVYMRRWRADPRHHERERLARVRAQIDRTVHPRYGGRRLFLTRRGRAVCGFCWRGQPVKMVERLKITETTPGEFLRVHIPCCVECWIPDRA